MRQLFIKVKVLKTIQNVYAYMYFARADSRKK